MASVGSHASSQGELDQEIIKDLSNVYSKCEPGGPVTKIRSFPSGHGTVAAHDPELVRIATALSMQVEMTGKRLKDKDPRLDPANDLFDFRFWATTVFHLLKQDGLNRPPVGFTFKNLSVSGREANIETQKTVASPFAAPWLSPQAFRRSKKQETHILHNFNGTVRSGEMLVVLGRPGSGCTTFLKSICGQLRGLIKSEQSIIHFGGISQETFLKEFKGHAVFNQEDDQHFPHLTVGQTLRFAAAARTPESRLKGVTRKAFSQHLTEVMMRIFGLSHVRDTKVGNDVVRGVSGGERKRVSIAEMALARSSVAAWDNSTRGLDAATALDFVRALRIAADVAGITQIVAIYQASQHIYDVFDKVMVLYDGRQIYFGPVNAAKTYFENMGWHCPPRQTTPDFLTSVTNPNERRPREGYDEKLPRTAEEFETYWLKSDQGKTCIGEVSEVEDPLRNQDHLKLFRESHHLAQAKHIRPKSPYIINLRMQLRLCSVRAWQLFRNDTMSTVVLAFGRVVLALIIGSIYYGPPNTTASLGSRGSVIFLSVLLNALLCVPEIGALFVKRPIIQKQNDYAFYHPFTEALGGMVIDVPLKFAITTIFNVIFYFLAGLRAEPANFFTFLLFNFLCTLLMSAVFRTIAASTKEITQAYAITGIAILAMIIYTGFTLQTTYMHPWFRWINWINPIGYVFEALLVNEVHGRKYPCASPSIIPPYGTNSRAFACAVIGAVPGQAYVLGDDWVISGYGYTYAHIWRNLGIILAFLVSFYTLYLIAIEFNSTPVSKPQRLIFRDRHISGPLKRTPTDIESGSTVPANSVNPSTSIVSEKPAVEAETSSMQQGLLTWRNITLDIKIRGQPRRLLDSISGWVQPGTLTCLMGVSGAGKTTLLDTLAQRQNTASVKSGEITIDGAPLDPSFQRKTGYVQQQDLHLETSTVREALRFSALLRQPVSVPREEKYRYVESIIETLAMDSFSEAIIGKPGEGLNLEQRKLLTIGVELAAKPSILFLDEPTSGLDSQSSWTIISFLRKLALSGQAVLCTIHQPSAVLFEQFDSLLLMAKGGKTAYFGPIGQDSDNLIRYFTTGSARSCDRTENPAEYMLEVIADPAHNWPEIWKTSREFAAFQSQLDKFHCCKDTSVLPAKDEQEFALSLASQFYYVCLRQFQQYWRSPGYIYAKYQAAIMSALFIGFSFFLQNSSVTGMQNTVFAIFMLNATFSTVVNQVMSRFVPQRSLFEIREAPSKMYSWPVFVLANIVVEIPYQVLLALIVWACWYFPVFGSHQDGQSQGLMLAFSIEFLLFASTFAQMIIAAMPSTEMAGNIATLLFSMTLQFNGVLQSPTALPGFWIFMYRVSPFTYLIGGWAGTGLANRPVRCAQNELAIFDPPHGETCGSYLSRYISAGAPGQLLNGAATTGCQYCPITNANQFLAQASISPSDRFRNFGILFAYIAFNILAALSVYYVFRVRRFSVKSLIPGKVHKRYQ